MVQATDDDYGVQKPDLPQALRLIDEMNDNVKQVSDVVGNMLQRVKSGEMSTESGLSFLEVKYHMLLNYLINLTYVVLRKCSGQRIEKDPAIDRLIEIRTVLEKIRPIDYKLRYQIDKLVKTAVTGTTNPSDPLNFKANPKNFLSGPSNETDDETESDESEDEKITQKIKKKSKLDLTENEEIPKYVPPKLTSMPYDADETAAEKEEKLRERARKRAISSAMIDEWKEEFLDTPVEITGSSRAQQMVSKAMRERERYEEENFTRLPMSKAEKHRQKRLSTMGVLGDELTSFSGVSSSGKKRKVNNKSKGGKKRKYR
ncbi:CLUMA_CG007290, isoform A [Clunio marinus]|uniref:CLUMA_CG007290, isoform A n=1 Tax=Clunio marinus TaxID=568069 RepID=A0A1J1I1X7_9DIPT|nr:CLUMA_CG007290, isoform A [Clunio marinus]